MDDAPLPLEDGVNIAHNRSELVAARVSKKSSEVLGINVQKIQNARTLRDATN